MWLYQFTDKQIECEAIYYSSMRLFRRSVLCVFLLIFISVFNLKAQDDIVPDRPGIGNGTYVLQPQVTYLESGLEYYNLQAGDQYSFGQVLLRGGLTKGVELRLVLNSFVIQNIASVTDSGIPDPGVGVKFNIYNEPESSLRLSGLGNLSIPIGSQVYTSDEWVPTTTLLADYSFTDYASVTANAGYTFGVGPLQDAWQFSVTPSYTFLRYPETSIFAGYAGVFSDIGEQQFVEAGITHHLESYLQLDVNTGYDVANEEFFVGGGIALRF